MATVYLAQDLRHDRKVAVKVLKPELAAVLGAERFVVEIKTTAALPHPHILPLFDSGSADGFLFYVMPYVEGETLRARLNRETQLGVDEAVRIGREVADALDYAHRHGVIHRDIKPENILLHDGRPMVADFGIALALSAAAGGRMTETGLSLGTPHYMSPEQATADKDITARSDIYSLGSVVYEMLTGNPPHVGASAQLIIMKIIAEPVEPVTKYRKSVPPNVAAAVSRSLEKLPADRFESAKAFADAMANPGFTSTSYTAAGSAAPGAATLRSNRPFLVAAGVAALALAAAGFGWLRPAPSRPVQRFGLVLPDSQALADNANGTRVAISPDGRTLAYVGANGEEANRLWVRSLDQLHAIPLPGTERAVNPSFSPDGKRIAFATTTPRALKVVPVAGGPVLTLVDSLVDLGGLSWGSDGYIYYDGHLQGDGIARVRESGGPPEIASRPDSTATESYHFQPSALPNGRGVLLTIFRPGGLEAADIGVLDTRTGRHKVLTRGIAARYSSSGHLVYLTAGGMLMAARFDLGRLSLVGEPVLLADGVAIRGNSRVDLGISPAGTLVYASGNVSTGSRELVWVTRDGVTSQVDSAFAGDLTGRPVLSPDGRTVAFTTGQGRSRQVWVKQMERGPVSRVAEYGWAASWMPDGRDLVFSSLTGLQRVPADGSRLPTLVHPTDGSTPSFSADGKWLVFARRGDLVGFQTAADTSIKPLVADRGTQVLPTISPDGRWLAYASDESGNYHVYVRPFPNTAVAKRQVSVTSGYAPRWSRTGRELFYFDTNSDLWVVEVPPGPVFTPGTPRKLFSALPFAPIATNYFDVSPDGRRFLFSRAKNGGGAPRSDNLVLVQNFFEELKARLK
jgi:serine/threonine-protein kinase